MNLRHRMTLLALLPATLVALLLTSVFLWHAIDSLEQGLHTEGVALSRQMATAAEYGIFSGQRANLSALADSALRIDADARGAAIVDARGTLLARSGELHNELWPALGRIEGQRLDADVLVFIAPVTEGNVPVDDVYAGESAGARAVPPLVGYAVVEMSRAAIAAEGQRLAGLGLLIAALVAVLGGWLAQRIARGVTTPLLEAGEVVWRIGHGDVAARMSTDEAGALKSLASGINAMAERIGMTQEELRARVDEATRDLLREKEAAEHATIAKSHFLAAASHDLRQPMHALGLFVAGLAESAAVEQEPRLVGQIQSAVDSLQHLLDAILDVSRLDDGRVVPRISNFPLTSLFDRLGDDLALRAQHKRLRFLLRPSPLWVSSDRQIVERILLNLVGNALRYTEDGGVLVGCRRRGDRVRIEVWDTGPGIPEHSREQIFDEYVQLGNPERDQSKGLGLGLAICRRLADLLGMPIGVRSRLGRGSVFWIELPVPEVAEAGPEGEDAAERLPPDDEQLFGTVLVVDSDVMVRIGMEQAIRRWGGNVLSAADRDEALRCCRQSPLLPDLAICAMRPPAPMDSLTLAAELQGKYGPLGILLVSADGGEVTQGAARRAGFPLLKEPIAPGRLRAALQHLLSERNR